MYYFTFAKCFFNLLSSILLNNELAVTESKLLKCVDTHGITISSFLGAGPLCLALKKSFFYNC